MSGSDITVLIMTVLMVAAFWYVHKQGRRDFDAAKKEEADGENARREQHTRG